MDRCWLLNTTAPEGLSARAANDALNAYSSDTDPAPLDGWEIHRHPLVFARTPVGFDAQLDSTIVEYGGTSVDALRDVEPADPRYWWQRRNAG
jgi:hypothetical protein